MTSEGPEFHTQPSTPISPIPYHPPVPSKLPVLEKQIDPIFNMTSTHTGGGASKAVASTSNSDHKDGDDSGSSSDANSFSDPFEEPDISQAQAAPVSAIQPDADDDYAMTFDSDGEGEGATFDTNLDNGTASTAPPSHVSQEPLKAASTAFVTTASTVEQGRISSKSQADSGQMDAPVPEASTAQAHAPSQGYRPSTPPPIYQSIQKGEIDIQQLLDNITANAELEAAKTTPNGATTTPSTLPSGSSAFPHTSLPPRPQALSNPQMNPAYAAQNDIRNYHAGPAYPAPPGTARRPPGIPGSLTASGAPGTHTDPRNELPPPPAASFSPPNSFSRPNQNMSHGSQRGGQHSRGPSSVGDVEDEGEIQWSPEVQRRYEEFLAEERRNVAEGVWDRFPMGSRLFIGKRTPVSIFTSPY